MTDSEVIERILKGEKDKYRILVEKYQHKVFATCMGYLHDKDDSEDLTQEILIQAYQALHKFRQESSFSTWLYRIAVNASLNAVRKKSGNFITRQLDGLFKKDIDIYPDFDQLITENPEEQMMKEEYRQWVTKALDSLPENQKTALVLSKYDDLPQKKIAEIMSLSEGAVEALIQRAKANMRKKLSHDGKKRG